MKHTFYPARLPGVLTTALVLASTPLQAEEILEEVVVTAEFRPVSELDLAASTTVFDREDIARREALHLEQLLGQAPNINLSSGASRGRFIQIRGIGERSQFVEPINPSVGLVIDGMDFTGIGGAAITMDMEQVEILRGPQGTLFGANALAGLINLVSTAPSREADGRVELQLGDHDLLSATAAFGAAIGDNSAFRLSAQMNQSDGFIDNIFLGKATNNIDERSARARFAWQASDRFDFDFTLFYTDIDNGYDAFSLDNTRETYSDQPGHDRLEALAGAVKARWQINSSLDFEALLSHVDADTEYGYDEDWSHPGICDNTPCDSAIWGFDWWYASTDNYLRNNSNTSLDLRLLSNRNSDELAWVAGLYYRDQGQDLLRQYTYADGDFASQYDTENLAAYGQIEIPLAEQWTVVAGLRYESRDWSFRDNSPRAVPFETADPARASDSENAWGGKLALEYRSESGILFYGLVSRGYKAGGYNTALAARVADLAQEGIEIPPEALVFDTETLMNYEAGVKGAWLDGRLQLSAAIFYQDRDDMQVKQSIVIPADPATGACPCNFIDSLQNASGGRNSGLEFQGNWLVTESLELFGSLGLLDTEYRDYLSYVHAEADPDNNQPYDLSGRAQAHAPEYQYSAGLRFWFAQHWMLQADVEGRDDAFASANHNEKLASYNLLNLRLAWQNDRWLLALWGRNLGDSDVQTRGFGGFGNDPRKLYETEPYYQLGEPRSWGISASLVF